MKTMLRILITTATPALLLFGSCQSDSDQAIINGQHQSLQEKDSLIREYVVTMNEIDANLDAVRDAYGLIILGPQSNVDEGVSKREQILRNIAMINDVLAADQKKLQDLEKALAASGERNVTLSALTKNYEAKIKESKLEIENLKGQVAQLSAANEELGKSGEQLRNDNAQLKTQNGELTVKVEEMDKEMHTGWFTVGTQKELRDGKIITRQGNLFTGRAVVLSPDLNNQNFAKVSTREEMILSLNSKKAKLITTHPANSYKLNKTEDGMLQLHITQPELFWSVSKYLVVETKA